MVNSLLVSLVLIAVFAPAGTIPLDGTDTISYNGYWFYDDMVPFGMKPDENLGWSHGSLFSAPNWLLAERMDVSEMSSVLDTGPLPATEEEKNLEGTLTEGYGYLEAGNYQGAYTAFKAAIEIDPTSASAWYGSGLALENQKRYLSALDAFSEAIRLGSSPAQNWGAYAGRGRVSYALNRLNDAVSALQTAISQYEQAGVTYPDELAEMERLLEEAKQRASQSREGVLSAYPPM